MRSSHRRLDGRPSVGEVLIDERARGSVHLGCPPRQIRLAGVRRFHGCGALLRRRRRRWRARRVLLVGAADRDCGEEEAQRKSAHARNVTGRQAARKRGGDEKKRESDVIKLHASSHSVE
jgi:hypothetical protein